MACVSTCPAKALLDGQDTPALRFVEANCLQCGLCETACPESAISLKAQYTWDSIEARKLETLHEEAPFHCVRCHTAFTTQAMIDTMTSKLAGHWMFQDGKAVRRLKLCGECRVKDIFEEDAKGINVHRSDA
jgi:ferredoxin